MTNAIRAQMLKLTTRRVLTGTFLVAVAFAIGAAAIVMFNAEDDPSAAFGREATIADLSQAGGATEAFSLGASFFGFFTFVLLVAVLAGEFSGGTIRTMLMRQPHRIEFLAGTVAGLLLFIAGAAAIALVLSVGASAAFAPSQDVSMSEWFTAEGFGEAAKDYATVLFAAMAWASYATILAVLVRSVPVALGIGIAWAGPFEHLVQPAIESLDKWFPGLLLESLVAGGTDSVAYSRALLMTAIYTGFAAVAAFTVFHRRDITAG